MKTKVTENGVVVPRDWFEGVDEVEIRRENVVVVVVPVSAEDPMLRLGRKPIAAPDTDLSEKHDDDTYGP